MGAPFPFTICATDGLRPSVDHDRGSSLGPETERNPRGSASARLASPPVVASAQLPLASALDGDVELPGNDVRILVCASDDGAEHSTTWGEFVADNADSLDGFELALIATALAAGRSYRGGGGAGGEWTVRPGGAA